MTLDFNRAGELVAEFKLRKLFIEEVGWDRPAGRDSLVSVDGVDYVLTPIAEKRSVQIFECSAPKGFPGYAVRQRIERHVRKIAHEHLIVFLDSEKTRQVWQWAARTGQGPVSYREHSYSKGQSPLALVQKLAPITFVIDDEEGLTLLDVTNPLKLAFDKEAVTRRFYDRFKTEQKAFLGQIAGIDGEGADEDRQWYASLMLNRLMFVYFIQKKGFLDGNVDYLRSRLDSVNSLGGSGKFLSFYRGFLRRLFHEGLGAHPPRASELEKLIGRVPYLNGGLFEVHELEERYPGIEIPDEAFRKVFDFFDSYQWHLDDRASAEGNQINPDVLGYIFEKYINQKQMGAYYTKEDVTGYITRCAVMSAVMDRIQELCAVAFEGEASAVSAAVRDSQRYLPPAMLRGVTDAQGRLIEVPNEIALGLEDVNARQAWSLPAGDEYALPTETWRDYAQRREHVLDVLGRLAQCDTATASALISENVQIDQLLIDLVASSDSTDFVRSAYQAVRNIRVLDPTCGSGAFLFSSLNAMESLLEACVDRMKAFVREADSEEELLDFRAVLAELDAHPNPKYQMLKSIVVNSLFGVDLMEEAVEICKLRLFLRLIAQARSVDEVEPLPDIDFNIQHGNALVGYAHIAQAQADSATTLDLFGEAEALSDAAERVAEHFKQFRAMQEAGTSDDGMLKTQLREGLEQLRNSLDRQLSTSARVSDEDFDHWRRESVPFHWGVEFHDVMEAGGFDAIVGNPPWVEYPKVKGQYEVTGFASEKCNNLWAFTVERSLSVLRNSGRLGLIVPMGLVCTRRMQPVVNLLRPAGTIWVLNVESDSNPGQLFDGVKQNVSILLLHKEGECVVRTTRLNRFYSTARDFVFSHIRFHIDPRIGLDFGIAKVGDPVGEAVLQKLFRHPPLALRMAPTGQPLYVHRIAHYFVKCFDFVPYFRSDRDGEKKSEDYKEYRFGGNLPAYVAAINSSLFYFYWQTYFDGFKAGRECVESFPFGDPNVAVLGELEVAGTRLMADMKAKCKRFTADYKATGRVEYDQFFPRESKSIMDVADRALAEHFGLSAEEADYVINFDGRFRDKG